MLWSTIKRAKEIVKENEVLLTETTPPHYFHFIVKQRNGDWTDVWYKKSPSGEMVWECNSVTKKKNGESWGCVMNRQPDKTNPYCSHTLAARIKLIRLYEMIKNKEECEP